MSLDAQIFSLLTSRKVFDGTVWRAYDSDGFEIPDLLGVLSKGVHGALLYSAGFTSDEPVSFGGMGSPNYAYRLPKKKDKKKLRQKRQNDQLLTLLLM